MTQLLPWRFTYASTQGRSHVAGDVPCQDSSLCTLLDDDGLRVLVAAVSDGAGSASHSEIGSRLACASFVQHICARIHQQDAALPLERSDVEAWLADFGEQIKDKADDLGLTPRDLACTFLGAVITSTWSAFCQVGDGGIVVGMPGEADATARFELVFWPEQGEYANETYFATMAGAPEHLRFRLDNGAVREVVLFSDGLQRMVLRYDVREPFEPFFHRMLQTVRRITDVSGDLHELSRGLAAYLGSPVVSERTDDDVSLVLATRCSELADPSPPAPQSEEIVEDAPELT